MQGRFVHFVLVPFQLVHAMDLSVIERQSNLKEIVIKFINNFFFTQQNVEENRNKPQIEITAKTTHVVTSGRYLMNTNAINAATNIK